MEAILESLTTPVSAIAWIIGLVASVLGIYEFLKRRKHKIKEYDGVLDKSLIKFIDANHSSIFKLSLQLNETQSRELLSWLQSQNQEPVIWFSILHDEYGTELGFHRDDADLHWNTRFWDSIHASSFFKVHSTQGPYQGWMSVTLRAVGHEHVLA